MGRRRIEPLSAINKALVQENKELKKKIAELEKGGKESE